MAMARLACSSSCGGHRDAKTHIVTVTEPAVCVYVVDVCVPAMCSSLSTNKREAPTSHHKYRQGTSETVDGRFRMSHEEKMNNLDRIKGIFYHAYESYLRHAFPFDELRPISCVGTNTDLTPGGMLTLIDAMDTLATIGNVTEFQRVVKLISSHEKTLFQLDSKVSVFETTIRILGGLLSAHLLCVDPELDFGFEEYDGALLRMARDLGDRLFPAFNTSTTVPYGTVSLMRGVPFGETTEACTAAAGSLSLEFGMLSVLTGDPKYGKAARSALRTIYDLRSRLNLIGRHLDVSSGSWTEAIAGIGSNIDSIYEYYLKQYILFGDEESLEWFSVLYEGAVRHLRLSEAGGRFYQEVDMKSGAVVRRYFSALQAFWPGVQVLAGDLVAAVKSMNGFMSVWESTGLLPEDFDLVRWAPVRGGTHPSYFLRPELAESAYYVHKATGDDSWLLAGSDMIDSVVQHCLVPKCGFASIQDVTTKHQMDSMPSFFLSEWVKYIYLMFDDGNFLNKGNWVFTTEAHPFRVSNATQSNDFAVSKFKFETKSGRRVKYSQPDSPIADIPSLDGEEDVCPEASAQVESYYKVSGGSVTMDMMKPFEKQPPSGGDATGNPMEKKISGYLDGVGTFEIVSTSNAFTVQRLDVNERLVISNLDSATGMVTANDGRPIIYVPLKHNNNLGFFYGSTCVVKVFASDMCGVETLLHTHAAHHALVYSGPCSVGDGFGVPRWYQYHDTVSTDHHGVFDLPIVSIPSAPLFCDAEFTRRIEKPPASVKGHFFLLASRGTCSFEEKARNAYALGAHGIIIALGEKKEEPFIMAHSWNGTKESYKPAVTAFLAKKAAGDVVKRLEARPGANPRVRVEVNPDVRVVSENGKITISAFADWQAVFGPMDDQGVYRLTLRKTLTRASSSDTASKPA